MLSLASKGVIVRLITDKDQIQHASSAVGQARARGIIVRSNESSYLMHHKFALVDGAKLINGSFNWTRQAITGIIYSMSYNFYYVWREITVNIPPLTSFPHIELNCTLR